MIRVKEEYKKKKIKNKANDNGQKMHFFGKKGALLIALAGLALGKIFYGKATEGEYTKIATAHNIHGDEFKGCIPIMNGEEVIGTVEGGSIIFVDDEKRGKATVRGVSKDGDVLQGSTDSKYIQKKGKIKTDELRDYSYIYQVVNVDDYLNVRNNTSLEEESKIGELYKGELVIGKNVVDSDENDIDWIPFLYEVDGKFEEAYLSSDYVRIVGRMYGKEKQAEILGKEEEEVLLQQKRVNENGKVVGIDISESTSPEALEKLLTNPNAIPSKGYKHVRNLDTGEMILTEFDMSDLKGPINYVFIKIGARGYGKEGNMVEYGDIFKEQAEVCENLEIPYGFYYYSTATDEKEAKEEVRYVRHALDKLESRRYNVLPFVIDSEAEAGHRTYKKDQTDVLAYWINKAEKSTGKVMLYTMGMNAATFSEGRIIDLDRLNKKVKSGLVNLWLSSHRNPENTGVYGENYSEDVEKQGEITMTQTITGVFNEDAGLGAIDIDIIDEEKYDKLIQDRLSELREQESQENEIDESKKEKTETEEKAKEKKEQAER